MPKSNIKDFLINLIILILIILAVFLAYNRLNGSINSSLNEPFPGNCVQFASFIGSNIYLSQSNYSLENIALEQNPFGLKFSSAYTLTEFFNKRGINSTLRTNSDISEIIEAVDNKKLPIALIRVRDPANTFWPIVHDLDLHFVSILGYNGSIDNVNGFYIIDSYYWVSEENFSKPYFINISEFEKRWAQPVSGFIFYLNLTKISTNLGYVRPLIILNTDKNEITVPFIPRAITYLMYLIDKTISIFGRIFY